MSAVTELVGSIYEAALEPGLWSAVLPALARTLNAERGVVGFTSPTRGRISVPLWHDVDDGLLHQWREEFGGFDPWYQRAGSLPRGTIVQGVGLIPWDELRTTEVHRAVFQAMGIDDLLCIVVANHGATHDFVTVHRSCRRGFFTLAERRLFRSLSMHLVIAAQINEQLSHFSGARSVQETLLDSLPYGVILIDGARRPFATNREAERILSARDGLGASADGLFAASPDSSRLLGAAIARACETRSGAAAGEGALLTLPRPSAARAYQVLVAPVVEGTRERIFARDCAAIAAIVVVSDPETGPQPGAETLRRLFGLTPTLARIAAALAAGATIAEYATAAGVTLGTARQQMKELFARMGIQRQAELVRAVLSSVAVLGSGAGSRG